MYSKACRSAAWVVTLAILLPLLTPVTGAAVIDGVPVTAAPVALTAKSGHIKTPDGGRYLMWGYALGGGDMQYPGPTLIVDQGTTVTINLTNELAVPVSIVFPGQVGVVATGGQPGLLTREAPPLGGTASYSFVASEPGTYLYHSGTRPELEVEMGLVGALIVRPPVPGRAYGHPDTGYDHEYLFLLTEMDAVVHDVIEFQGLAGLGAMDYFSTPVFVYWFINGRAAPDTLLPAGSALLPTQPYNCLPQMHPGERLLLRILGGGKAQHPFHTHGNHVRVIARNGRLLESAAGQGPDLSTEVFTVDSIPGETVDAIFEWTGKGLNWDIYGTGPGFAHNCGDPLCPDASPADGFDDTTGVPCYDETTREYCPDHGKALPVTLPDVQQVAIGAFYSGSPFMGAGGFLPPEQASFNVHGGFTYPWHSHAEKELTNFNIFPGGILTFLIIEPHGVSIP